MTEWTGYAGKKFNLIRKATGEEVKLGDPIVDFRGDKDTAGSIRAPQKESSNGHVNNMYAKVFDLKFVEATNS